MDKVSICHECGRTVESAFAFCPWCGCASESGPLISVRVDEVFADLESRQKENAGMRITRIENDLGELEDALSILLSLSHPI